jgi:hypothetical protein
LTIQATAQDAVWSPAGGGTQHVYVRGTADNLLELVDDGLNEQGWSAYDRTADTGAGITGDPAVYATPGGPPQVYVRGTAEN